MRNIYAQLRKTTNPKQLGLLTNAEMASANLNAENLKKGKELFFYNLNFKLSLLLFVSHKRVYFCISASS